MTTSDLVKITQKELGSPTQFRRFFKKELSDFSINLMTKARTLGLQFSKDELGDLALSACRMNDHGVILKEKNRRYISKNLLKNWFHNKIFPFSVEIELLDEDLLKLLLFSIEMTFQMFSGCTRATVTQKGFRQRRRTFDAIITDQFVGKLGEIVVKKFLESHFNVKIKLDWEISKHVERYRNDIMNAKHEVSIKTSLTLSGIWAEADVGYDFGIFVKCSVPQPTILQFFVETSGFEKLLSIAENSFDTNDEVFLEYLNSLRNRFIESRKTTTTIKGIVCGYFKTIEHETVKEGANLKYLGKVREERFIVPLKSLKCTLVDWKYFLEENEIL